MANGIWKGSYSLDLTPWMTIFLDSVYLCTHPFRITGSQLALSVRAKGVPHTVNYKGIPETLPILSIKWNMMTSSNGSIFRVTGPLCGEFTGPGEFPAQTPVTRSFDVFFDLRLNKQLSKQPRVWWFETLPWSLWRQCNEILDIKSLMQDRSNSNALAVELLQSCTEPLIYAMINWEKYILHSWEIFKYFTYSIYIHWQQWWHGNIKIVPPACEYPKQFSFSFNKIILTYTCSQYSSDIPKPGFYQVQTLLSSILLKKELAPG